jgi:dCMP deaminase
MSEITCIPWEQYFINLAEEVSTRSKDPSTHVGAVLVGYGNEILSTGYNSFPRGVQDLIKERWERPTKYTYVAHAEANAIVNAARVGTCIDGAILYLNWEPIPCNECAKLVINAGISSIVGPPRPFKRYANKEVSITMLQEAGIDSYVYSAYKDVLVPYKGDENELLSQ